MNDYDYYTVLGILMTSSKNDIVKAFKTLVVVKAYELHPDKNPNDPEAMIKYELVVKAYRTLTDSIERALHDIQLNGGACTPSTPEEGSKNPDPEAERLASCVPRKPGPGAYRYTADGMPVGKEEESRPEKAAEEWERWKQMMASGPPPAPKPDSRYYDASQWPKADKEPHWP